MNKHSTVLAILAFGLLITFSPSSPQAAVRPGPGPGSHSPLLLAEAGGMITILSPKEGEAFKSGSGIKLKYNIKLSPDGNHIHVYIDDQSPIIDRDVENCPCSITLPDLSSGEHTIFMKEATVSHVLTGVEAKVDIKVK